MALEDVGSVIDDVDVVTGDLTTASTTFFLLSTASSFSLGLGGGGGGACFFLVGELSELVGDELFSATADLPTLLISALLSFLAASSAVLRLFALWLVEAKEGIVKALVRPAKEELWGKASLGSVVYCTLFRVVLLLVVLLEAVEDASDVETIEDTMASTVVVFATSAWSSFLVVAFSRLLILSVKLFFFSLTNEVVVVDEAEAEVNELERKEVDIVKVLRTGRELKVVRDLEPVIKDCFALCSSTVVVSTLEASLMNVTLSFEDDLLSIIGASEGLRLGSSGSLGT